MYLHPMHIHVNKKSCNSIMKAPPTPITTHAIQTTYAPPGLNHADPRLIAIGRYINSGNLRIVITE